ncbi:MAG TPA: 2Fe-2S iron-sulfur cluster-binding protein [Bryobacteraceae bacterium]|nr:2Fe-2S iron-sulfur cluster-binding protein [Bryobacteraceae bacterium]
MDSHDVTRREFVGTVIAGSAAAALPEVADAETASPHAVSCTLTINGESHALNIDSRVTLLDLLREQLRLTGTKKGCDHGQCGACTVLVNGRRVNSCLSFAAMHDGERITTIEGLGQPGHLHTMQAAFIDHDGFQCGYCTPGQICSAVAMLQEVRAGSPSMLTPDIHAIHPIDLTDEEIRERMSGNICRCGAYPNIVDAIRTVQQENLKGQEL